MLNIGLLALFLAIASNLIYRLFTSKEDMRRRMELMEWNKQRIAAMRKGDKKALEKLDRKKEYMQKIQTQMMFKSLANLSVAMILFLFIFWYILPSMSPQSPVASIPQGMDSVIPLLKLVVIQDEQGNTAGLSPYGWFIISYFGLSMVTSKVLRPKPEEFKKPR